ncbi:MAG TPA: BlaI/MecI/CopY family transcriptional regulator [Candidatus Anaerotignum merdipullorum]|nr:BlaI/MecI/CopY family transcriptional regulator [Candidatus Anaerotignum merdipullorum]
MSISDSDLKVLEFLWKNGSCKASYIKKELEKEIGWSPNTTYTVLTRAVQKGLIKRSEPGFMCTPLVGREDVQTSSLIEIRKKLFDDSNLKLVKSLIDNHDFSDAEIKELYALIDKEMRLK